MKIFIKVFSIILFFNFHLFTLSLSPTTENLKQILFKLSQKELLPCKFWGKYCEIWLTTEPRAIKAVHENFTITIFASALERIVHNFALWLNWEKRSTVMIGWKWEKQSMENFRAACLPSTLSRTDLEWWQFTTVWPWAAGAFWALIQMLRDLGNGEQKDYFIFKMSLYW